MVFLLRPQQPPLRQLHRPRLRRRHRMLYLRLRLSLLLLLHQLLLPVLLLPLRPRLLPLPLLEALPLVVAAVVAAVLAICGITSGVLRMCSPILLLAWLLNLRRRGPTRVSGAARRRTLRSSRPVFV